MSTTPALPLAGIRVIDTTEGIAGPFCTRMLAGYGADVIKIERPGTGDPSRAIGPFPGDEPHPERSGSYLVLNMAKRSVTLDWRTERGSELLRNLVRTGQVFVESGGDEDLAWLGLDDHAVERDQPDLIVTSVTPYGLFGPYRDYAPAEAVFVAAGGLISMQGDPEREPLKNAGNMAQMGAGLDAFVATLAALYGKAEYGQGEHIDQSVFDHVATLIEAHVQMWKSDGKPRRRQGNLMSKHWGLFPAREGHIGISFSYRADLTRMAHAWDVPELWDPKYDDYHRGKSEHLEEIEALAEGAFASYPAAELYHRAQAQHVPIGYVVTPVELLESPQLHAREFFVEIDHPEAGRQQYPSHPVRFSEAAWRSERAPLLGEHTDEVLTTLLGLTGTQIDALRTEGVV